METLIYRHGEDNICDFYFMEDFTTVALADEEYGIDTAELKYKDEDDFYCFSEDRSYTEDELFARFNIQKVDT